MTAETYVGREITACRRPDVRFGGRCRDAARFSTLFALGVAVTAIVLLAAAVLLGRTSEPAGRTVLTVRLWDQQVATAYRQSFDAFTAANPDVEVRIDIVSYATYFDTLRTDVAGGSADDIFWINNANFAAYADSGRLMPIEPSADWVPSVVEQFTRNGTLWGVPQLSDAGIAVYYNADLLAQAGLTPDALTDLRWGGPDDTLRPLAARLTVDGDGNRAGTPGFDPRRIRQWGYNAANDFQGIYLNFIGSAGGTFHDGDAFTFDSPQAARAFDYLVTLINEDHVAPGAADTNDNGDFSRNQFLAGRMALFQSGTYNLANVASQADVPLGRGHAPDGPGGPGQCHQRHCRGRAIRPPGIPTQVRRLLAWLGSAEGNAYVGAGGAAIPAVISAQQVYRDYWRDKGVDVSPFFQVLDGPDGRPSPRRAARDSPPASRPSSPTSTRCSWAGCRSTPHSHRHKSPRTPPHSGKTDKNERRRSRPGHLPLPARRSGGDGGDAVRVADRRGHHHRRLLADVDQRLLLHRRTQRLRRVAVCDRHPADHLPRQQRHRGHPAGPRRGAGLRRRDGADHPAGQHLRARTAGLRRGSRDP